MPGVSGDLDLALALADGADAVTTARFRSGTLVVESKPDLTPVTEADRSAENAIREHVARERPDDAVVGEEFGASGAGPRRWVIDPIDGTKNFVRGHPVWATLIALQDGADITVGVVSAPALGRRWWCSRGGGSWTRDIDGGVRRCQVSAVGELTDAFLSYSGLGGWQRAEQGFRALTQTVWRTRAYGDFWSYAMVAEGVVDIACEPEVSLWDLAPLLLLVEEAGGTFTDLSGVRRADGGSALATNGLLHDTALAFVRPPA
ncbi:MAG: histidinol-phosphatase [Actinomycetes bacterium]